MISSVGKKIASRFDNVLTNRLPASLGSAAGKAMNSARDIPAHIDSSRILKASTNRKVQAAGVGAIAGASFLGGLDNNRQVSDPFFNLTTGSSDYDNYVLGTDVGARGLLAPLPGERMFGQSTIQPGSILGGVGGGLAGLKLSGIKGGLVGAAAGAVLGQTAFAAGSGLGTNAVLTSTTYNNAYRKAKKNMPSVDGSMALGMYNARLG